MIAALRRAAATTGRLIEAAVNARTLARTVLVLSRQLDNAHLLAASEEARADRAELRVAELEAETRDWAELSGELAAEQPADDALPDLTDAGDEDRAPPLSDAAREAAFQWGRAEDAIRRLQACEVELATMREANLAAEIRADVQRERAEQAERDRDTNARAAGAHIATIESLREQIAAAHRAAHAPARSLEERADNARAAWEAAPHTPEDDGPAWQAVVRACDTSAAPVEQIPGVAAADDLTESERREGYHFGKLTGIGFAAGCEAIAETKARMARPGNATADTDDPPPTRPSERTRTT